MNAHSLSVIIPAFNEIQAIESELKKLNEVLTSARLKYEMIVVDDGSTDGTGEAAEKLNLVKVLRHERNKGYGAALKTGIRSARHDIICIVDADCTYPLEDIPDLVNVLIKNQLDMVVGARTGKKVVTNWVRFPAKWILRRLANYLAGFKIPDLNSGLRVMKKDTVQRFFNILPSGFSFTTTITLAMLTNDFRVDYVPVNYYARKGNSKIRPLPDILNFLMLIIRTTMYFNPLKIFLPISMGMFLCGTVLLLFRFFVKNILISTTITLFVGSFTVLAIGLLADLIDKRISYHER